MIKRTFKKVGVVIVTYNSEKYIRMCLKSIQSNSYPNFETLAVDNSSQDKTAQVIKKGFKKVGFIENKKNLGFSAANNIGIKYLLNKKCDYILLINPDTVSSPTLIEKLVNSFEINKKIAVAGCIITYAKDRKKIWFGGGYFNNFFCYSRHKYMNKSLKNVEIKSGYVDFITGACMMIDSKIFKKMGFLPEDYFLYFEDLFFCQKIKEKGFLCYLLALPLAYHYVSTSTGVAQTNIMSPLRAYFFARNPIIYIKKNVKGFRKITNLAGQFLIRLPFYAFKIIFQKEKTRPFFYYCRGIFDGILGKSPNPVLNNR
ncbi:MAG: glycosyltransferase family 2 protein [Candidatus Levybacteria bacterium]|nr:glycosyltransferase family 2 protein [Candidatus Levybacteria bacterium]